MLRFRWAFFLALAGLALLVPRIELRAEPRAVVELFTSQGCSSCPAADKLAGELARDPSLLVMTLAIDYWDYLGWKDTLALSGNTKRQRAYAKARGDREVYTPQAVVNGMMHVLGSDKVAIKRAIEDTSPSAALPVPVKVSVANGNVTVDVPAGSDEKTRGEVWLCPIAKTVPVEIVRGENRGRTITYTNVVRRWVKLGEWTGKPETFAVPLGTVQTGAEIDSVAVVVQSGSTYSPTRIVGAAQTSLR
jgi:hypothetical protein